MRRSSLSCWSSPKVVTLYGTGFQQVDVYLDGQLSETRMMNFG